MFSSLPNKVNYSYYSSELNFLIDISIFGIKTYFITAIPDNFIGQSVLRSFDSFRINRDNVLVSNKGRIGIKFEEEGYGSRLTSTYYDRIGSTILVDLHARSSGVNKMKPKPISDISSFSLLKMLLPLSDCS